MEIKIAALASTILALFALVFVLPAIAATCKGWATLDEYIVIGGGDVNCGTTGCTVCADDCDCCECRGFIDDGYPIKDSSRAAIAFNVLALVVILPALVMLIILTLGKFGSAKYVVIPLMFLAAIFTIIAWGAYVGKLKENGRKYTLKHGFVLSVISSLFSIASAIVGFFIKI